VRGRLNLFQAAMLRWRSSYPYNAVHVAELPGPLDERRLSQAIDTYLTEAGIGKLALDGERRRYQYVNGPVHAEVPVSKANGDTRAMVEREMERYLNGRFGDDGEPFAPLRFFAVDSGASFHLGVAYDHFIAGGDSMVTLLQGIAIDIPAFAPVTGYISFFALVLYVVALLLIPPVPAPPPASRALAVREDESEQLEQA